MLNAERGASCTVDQSMAMTFYSGQLRAFNENSPSNLSPFLFAQQGILDAKSQRISDVEWDLRIEHGEITQKMINEAISVKPTVPGDVLELRVQLENTLKAVDFLFGMKSLPCYGINAWLDALKTNHQTFRVRAASDNKFIASILMIIHNRIQLFLSSCAQADKAENIDASLLDFADVIRRIMTGDFTPVLLPPVIEQAALQARTIEASPEPSTDKKREAEEDNPDDSPPKKRTKTKTNPAKNPQAVPEWKVERQDFPKFHQHRENLPKVNDKEVCLKYQLLGSCNLGKDCKRHHGQLKDQVKIDFQQWFDNAKRE